jgi:hypothetical protein
MMHIPYAEEAHTLALTYVAICTVVEGGAVRYTRKVSIGGALEFSLTVRHGLYSIVQMSGYNLVFFIVLYSKLPVAPNLLSNFK